MYVCHVCICIYDLLAVLRGKIQITCNDHTTLKIIKNGIKLTPSLKTSRGADEAAAAL